MSTTEPDRVRQQQASSYRSGGPAGPASDDQDRVVGDVEAQAPGDADGGSGVPDDVPPPEDVSAAGRGRLRAETRAGWLFISPFYLLLLLFIALPILMAVWVSFLDWSGQGGPFGDNATFVGLDNYRQLLVEPGLVRGDFMLSLRNNLWYVLFVVPTQTILALTLAVLVNQRFLKGRGFFRSAFYFPSLTSSIAISIVFLFLFQNTGAVNDVLGFFGIDGPAWFADPRGLLHVVLANVGAVDPAAPPAILVDNSIGGLSLWQWLAGPSVAMMSIISLVTWTTAGTFMLMFIAALQDIPLEVEEAGMVDGANAWQNFRFITVPSLKPVIFLVLTLGFIGTWQVFDQVYVMSGGNPAKTTLTPAYLSYQTGFAQFDYGTGAAMAFLLFVIIMLFVGLQRLILRDERDEPRRSLRDRITSGKESP